MSGLSSRPESAMYSDFMGFALDDTTLAALRQWAERQGHPRACVMQGGLDMFSRMVESAAPPKLVVLDLDGQDDPAAALARLFAQGAAGARVVAIGAANDVSLYRRLTQAGAADYLVKPVSSEQLQQALSVALRGKDAAATGPKESRVIVVIGARGGIGASSLALNLGWQLAHKGKTKTALFDLDLQFGTGSLALDLEPARGLRDIVSSPSRVDGLMIASALMPESPEFSVLAAEEPIDDTLLIDGTAVTALVKELKGKFGAVVVDLPRQQAAVQKRLLATAQDIVIVSDMSLAGIRDTLRLKSLIAALASPARVSIVTGRVNGEGAGQVDAAAFEKGVQGKIDARIPEDRASFAAAANSGKALGETAPNAEATKVIAALAVRLAGTEEAQEAKPSLLSKWLGKGAKGNA